MPIRRYPRSTVMGQWVELPNGAWDWDKSAPAGDPSPTYMLPAYAASRRHELRESPMSQPEDGLVSFDPDDPHDPAMADLDSLDRAPLQDPVQPDIALCPTCGTAVSRDRLR